MSHEYFTDRPEDYRLQNGCHNCRHCFVYTEYDQGPEYYCGLNAPPRPPCCSVGMGECEPDPSIPSDDYEAQHQASLIAGDKWRDWSQRREVNAAGICGHHEAKEGSV